MSLQAARAVADAVLWEGYLLYPYRATSAKNRIRWQFGVLGPPGAAGRAGVAIAEDPAMRVECLLCDEAGAVIQVGLRFLHLVRRQVRAVGPGGDRAVEELRVGGRVQVSFEEAVACELGFGPFGVQELRAGLDLQVAVPAVQEVQDLSDADGSVAGRVVRHRRALTGSLVVRSVRPAGAPDGWLRLVIDIANTHGEPVDDREAATAVSFLGAHLLLGVQGGVFGSLLEPPAGLDAAARDCRQLRCWPVLAGSDAGPGRSDIVLASPIILYDHPAVAPESAGALFDSTEIDEILTLRVMTLTDEEKAAARATDPAAAAIIDRCDGMSAADLARLHGTLRDPRAAIGSPDGPWSAAGADGSWSAAGADGPWSPGLDLTEVPVFGGPTQGGDGASHRLDAIAPPGADKPWWDPGVDAAVSPSTDTVVIDGVPVSRGCIVRLRPGRRADAQDLFYAGQSARVVSVYSDVDGNRHVAVVLTDDPAADLHEWYGRYLYFAPDELEPISSAGAVPVTSHNKEHQP